MNQKEYDQRRELIELEHKYRTEEIELKFQRELEVQRIKAAEIRKSVERRNNLTKPIP